MPKLPQNLPERLTRKAARHLPKKHRAEYLANWLAELEAIDSQEDRLEYAKGLKLAAKQTRCELDPEDAFFADLTRGGLVLIPMLIMTSAFTSWSSPRLFALTLPDLMGVMFLTNLSVRASLFLPAVRAVWWRKWAMFGMALVCGSLALVFLDRHNAVYPSLHFPMLASAFLGGYAAYYFHPPRPALKR